MESAKSVMVVRFGALTGATDVVSSVPQCPRVWVRQGRIESAELLVMIGSPSEVCVPEWQQSVAGRFQTSLGWSPSEVGAGLLSSRWQDVGRPVVGQEGAGNPAVLSTVTARRRCWPVIVERCVVYYRLEQGRTMGMDVGTRWSGYAPLQSRTHAINPQRDQLTTRLA